MLLRPGLIVVGLLAAAAQGEQGCDELGVLLYEDLGCTPVTPEGARCPTEYRCPSFGRAPDHCTFRGRRLALGEVVATDLIISNCQAHCVCGAPRDGGGGPADFHCPIFECPEWLGGNPLPPHCHHTYKLNSCCSSGHLCPAEESRPVGKCDFEGKSYWEGQRMHPANSCSTCVCQGDPAAPLCQRRNCSAQLQYAKHWERSCAPAYSEYDICCPHTWICPEDGQEMAPTTAPPETSSDLTCVFGSVKFKIGAGFKRTVEDFTGKTKEFQCKCVVPPLMMCK